MTIKTASPGVFVQEIDLTRGTADAITENVGFCAGPFVKGPVDQITLVTEEVEFKRIFGGPTDENYEYWHSINNFLEYSGTCYVVRCDDAVGDTVDQSTGFQHPQKMRNSTDNFKYVQSGDTDPNLIEASETTSLTYVKNPDDYFTAKGGLVATTYDMNTGDREPGTGGTFLGRTPGEWTNGIGVAVIDRGADYQLTLRTDSPILSTANTIFINGMDAAFDPNNTATSIDGGEANATARMRAEAYTFQREARADFPEEGEIVDGNLKIGSAVARYVKLVPEQGFDPINIKELSVVEGSEGSGLVTDEGESSGIKTAVDVDNIGDTLGTGLKVNLFLEEGKAVAATVYSGSVPSNYQVGNQVRTNIPGVDAADQVTLQVQSEDELEGSVIKFGTAVGAIVSFEAADEEDADPLYYTVALMPQEISNDGKFGDYQTGDSITDKFGGAVGTVSEVYDLGEFVYYRTSGQQIVDVIWRPKTYTRNEGMQYYWPNRPFDGELVFNGKIAVNNAGNPIEDEASTPANPIYKSITGAARVTSATGDVISWDSIEEKWVQTYVPKKDDILYNPFTQEPHSVLFVNDWYAQQVAYEGIPWTQFAPRPGTSANAKELGCKDDEINIIVYDALGNVTNQKGTVLESYYLCSKFKNAKTVEGSDNYYKNLINNNSEFIYSNERVKELGFNHKTGDDGVDDGINYGRVVAETAISTGLKCALLEPRYGAVNFERLKEVSDQTIVDIPYLLLGGEDQLTASLGEVQAAYQKIDEENVDDLDYIIQGPATDLTTFTSSSGALGTNSQSALATEISAAVAKANFLIALAEDRKDCMAVVSPPRICALDPVNAGVITQRIIQWAGRVASSSYAIMDSGYKYMYDRFSDKYRYVPLNADIAGCMSYTSLVSEPFFSPAGMSRGRIKHVVKLGYDPSKAQRDQIFTARVNPVVTFPGEGTVLYGDKTALGFASAFDRINVRKLFIYVEREIAKIAKNVLFEFNDVPTRVIFKNNVNPFLRDVQSKRGMTDFLVVCDESNNTPEVIDRNEFIADIYIKPSRSINFVQLTFVATKTGVSFGEAVGSVRRSTANSQ